MWTALYLPTCNTDDNPTKNGFESEEAAWEHVFSNMCKGCREERQLALDGKPFPDKNPLPETISQEARDDFWQPSTFPACSCEWLVMKTEDLDKCDDLADVFEASGMKRVWP